MGFAAASAEYDLDVAEGRRCPRCGSPQPQKVEVCPHDFHLRVTPQNTADFREAVRTKRKAKPSSRTGHGQTDTGCDMNRMTKQRRLERAGYVHVSGWVSDADADEVRAMVEYHAENVAKALAEPPLPRGRPKIRRQDTA
jgi:hypothetical protein